MKRLIVLVAALMATTLAYAIPIPVTYHYTGNNYDTIVDETPPAGTTFNTGQRVTGSLTFASPLADMALGVVAPIAFSFSNGAHTFTQLDTLDNASISLEVVGGVITHWDIQFNDQYLYAGDPLGKQENILITSNTGGTQQDSGQLLEVTDPTCCANIDSGTVNRAPGAWSVPEPGTFALLAAPLLLNVVRSRRRRSA